MEATETAQLELTKKDFVYLDSNVFIDIFESNRERLREYLLQESATRRTLYPFTAAQVLEVTKYPKTERCHERLEYISAISNNTYYVHSVLENRFKVESPHVCYDTNTEAFPNLNLAKIFSHMLPHFVPVWVRKRMGIDTNKLNNMSGPEAVKTIDAAIAKYAAKKPNSKIKSIKDHVEYSRQSTIRAHGPQWKRMGSNVEHLLYAHDLQTVFTLLDFYGYYPDKKKTYYKGSRYADSEHVAAAQHSGLMVTGDKGMRKRAQAAYLILGIGTEVILTKEYENGVLS